MAAHVTAALVVAHVNGKVQHLYHGDVVPAGIDKGSLANLVSLGFVSTDDEVVGEPQGFEPSDMERPAEAGPGSAKEKWLAYAAAKGVEVDAEASKEDIVKAVSDAGH